MVLSASRDTLEWAKTHPESVPLSELADRVRGALTEGGRPDLAAGIDVVEGYGITALESHVRNDAETLLKVYRIAGGSRPKCPNCWRAERMLCECGAAESVAFTPGESTLSAERE